MTNIEVWTKDSQTPLVFENVESFYERRKTLDIIQEEMYQTSITVIRNESIIRYTIIDKR